MWRAGRVVKDVCLVRTFLLKGNAGSRGVARDVCLARTFLPERECREQGELQGFLCLK